VRRDDRHARAGHRQPDVGRLEDLAGLEHHLALFVRVVVAVLEVAGAAEHVERDRVRIDGRGGRLGALEHRAGLRLQLLHGGHAGARHGLVGGDDQPLDPDGVEDRLDRDHQLHRRAVGVGDQAAVALERVRVDL
jgi:hypothetical protein